MGNLEFKCIGKNIVLIDKEEVHSKKWIDFKKRKKSESSQIVKEKMLKMKEKIMIVHATHEEEEWEGIEKGKNQAF